MRNRSHERANVINSNSMVYTTKRLSSVFKALGNERRMAILKLLAKKPLSVIEVSDKLDLSFKSVSKHLQKLDREGVLDKKQEGRHVFYRITDSFRKSGACRQILESK